MPKKIGVYHPDNKIGQNSGKTFGKYSHHLVVKGVRANNKIIRKLQIEIDSQKPEAESGSSLS